MLNTKIPVWEIAAEIGRHVSTIFPEIKRNFWADDAFPKKYAGYFGHANSAGRSTNRACAGNAMAS